MKECTDSYLCCNYSKSQVKSTLGCSKQVKNILKQEMLYNSRHYKTTYFSVTLQLIIIIITAYQ